jgi:type II secretory pathway component GspD/PulD (secretin)
MSKLRVASWLHEAWVVPCLAGVAAAGLLLAPVDVRSAEETPVAPAPPVTPPALPAAKDAPPAANAPATDGAAKDSAAKPAEPPRVKYWLNDKKAGAADKTGAAEVVGETPAPEADDNAAEEDRTPTELTVGNEPLVVKENPAEHPDYVLRRARLQSEIDAKLAEARQALKKKQYERVQALARNVLSADPRNRIAADLIHKSQEQLLNADEHVTIVAGERRDREALIEVEEHSNRPPARTPMIRPQLPQRGDDEDSAKRRSMAERLNEPVTVDFLKADLEWVLNTLFILTGVNIIADQAALEGKSLTLHVEKLPLKEVLNFIVRNNEGIQYSITEDAVWITASESSDMKKIMFPRIYPLRYGLVSTKQGSGVSTGDRSDNTGRAGTNNSSGRRGQQGAAPAQPSAGGQNEQPTYLETVLEWMKESKDPQTFPDGSNYLIDRQTNQLIVFTTPAGHEEINRILDHFDQPPIQVLIKTRFLEIDSSEDKGLGVNLDRFNTRVVDFNSPFPADSTDSSATGTTTPVRDPFRAFNFLGGLELPATGSLLTLIGRRTDPQFQVSMRALLTNDKTKVLSQPQILALNNKEATIDISQSFYYIDDFRPVTTTNAVGNGTTVSNVTSYVPEYAAEKVGFTLVVTPSVGRDLKTINLHLSPIIDDLSTDSSFDAFTVFTQNNPSAPPTAKKPAIDQRSFETDVVMEDNGYVIIGGLERSRRESHERKIPGLWRMPWIGGIFKSTSNKVIRRNLIIIVEAQIISPGGRTYYKDKEADDVDVREGGVPHAPGQISGVRRADRSAPASGVAAARKYQPGDAPQVRQEEKTAQRKPESAKQKTPSTQAKTSVPVPAEAPLKPAQLERQERLAKASQQAQPKVHAALRSSWDLAEEDEASPAIPAGKEAAPAVDRKDTPAPAVRKSNKLPAPDAKPEVRGEVIDLPE